MWLRLNSAGRCSAICDQTGSRCRPSVGAAQPGVGLLQRLGRLGVPPHHDVGVGPQAGDVVDPADDDVLAREFVEQGARLVGRRGPLVVGERAGQPEHRPHRVADGGVQLVRPLADAALVGLLLAHAAIVPWAQRAAVVGLEPCVDAVLCALRQSSHDAIHGRWRRQRKGRIGASRELGLQRVLRGHPVLNRRHRPAMPARMVSCTTRAGLRAARRPRGGRRGCRRGRRPRGRRHRRSPAPAPR